jgi:DNA-directed RNA polymerase specialized sigma24 family protein
MGNESCVRRKRTGEIRDNPAVFVTGRTAGEEIRMWTRVAFLTEGVKLLVYERIVKYYLRYVLLRCCEYTNSRREAEQIAAYTLITTCSLLEQLRHAGDLVWLIDRMVEVIAEERSGRGRLEGWEEVCGDGALLGDEKLWSPACRVNRFDGLSRQVLVLGLIEKMSPKTISEIYGKPVEEIVLVIDGAERELAECLSRVSGEGSVEVAENVFVVMRRLGEALEPESRRCITKAVLFYLAKDGKEDCKFSGRLAPEDLN